MTVEDRTISGHLGAFAERTTLGDLPPAVADKVRLHILDILGVCLLGSRMPFAQVLLRTVQGLGPVGEDEASSLYGAGLSASPLLATIYNGGLAHGNEFDDTYGPGRWHGSAPVVPPGVAIAESINADGRSLVTAVAVGLEIGCRLTKAAPTMLASGFHSTSSTGVFSATAAVGKLLGLSGASLAAALGIAGSFASGTTEYLNEAEPWPKRIQVGHASGDGIIAALAASQGFGGPARIFESDRGYFPSYAGEGNFDLSEVTDGLGDRWEINRLYPKLYPCDHVAQSYVDATISLAREYDLREEIVDEIQCVVHPLVADVMFTPQDLRYDPPNGWSARWSMPFTLASALAFRELDVSSYDEARLRDLSTRSLMSRVTYVEDVSLPFPADYPGWVRITLRDGTTLEKRILAVAGSETNPVPADRYEEKFRLNARGVISSDAVEGVIGLIRDRALQWSVRELASLCRASEGVAT